MLTKNTRLFPNFLMLLSFAELWERFSYYGMRALLVLYLTLELGFSDARSYNIYFLFAAIGYAGPVIFGTLADKYFGFKYMVIVGGIIMTIGHAAMAFSAMEDSMIFVGLALIALGTGAFKGNITNLLGSCYGSQSAARERGFMIFYVAVNLGSFIASLSCAFVAHQYGWHYGFGLAGIGMLIGLIIFIKNMHIIKEDIVTKKIDPQIKSIFLFGLMLSALIINFALRNAGMFTAILNYFGIGIFSYYAYLIYKAPKSQKLNLITIFIFTLFMMLFFAIEMQLGSLINLFAQRNVDRYLFGFEVPAAVSQAINPLSIIVFGPIFSAFFKFNPKYKFLRFAFGLSTMSISFIILYMGCLNADSLGKTSYLFFVVGLMPMGIGELLIAPFAQSQVAILAPEGKKGFVIGILMLALAFANLAGSVIAKFMTVPSVQGNVDSLVSLQIYKGGFLQIAFYNFIFVIIFILLTPILSKAYKNIKE